MAEDSLKGRTAKGLLWGMVNNGTTQLLNAVFGILLLQRLYPSDYGKIAMLLVFANIASTLQESGFTAALCNLREPTHRDYNAVFWFNIGVSAILYLILFLAAPLIVWFYHDPDLLWLSRYLFLGFFISSWGTVQRAYLFIHLMNKQTAIIGIVALVVAGTVGVTMVYNDYAYWGLATQNVLFILIVAVMNWFYSPWRPSLKIDLRPAWQMFGFSSKLLAQNLFNNLNAHAFGVLLGRFYGDHSAGVYSNARKWDDMGINTINGMVSGVAQPVLTRVKDDSARYRHVFRKMLRFVSFISFPAMLGLGLIAREFLLLAGGEKWLESATLLSMLSIYGAFFPITTLYSNLTISQGRSGINLWCTIVLCIIIWAGLIALHPYGLRPMVMFFITVNILWLFVWQWFAHRLIGLRLWDVLRDILPFFVFTVLVMTATWWLTHSIVNLWLSLFCKIGTAVLLYGGIMWVSGAKIMRESVQYLTNGQFDK
ncbi:MAG: lipopolysaccharide biosynthesis protein [Bacteroidaceae bacterium]|nr:lipopolysaccharide biosynthesis protein [Bacteroidaceae bacterium]